VLEGMNEVVAMKGKKIVRYDLKKDKPSDADLKAIIIGPTGNLRAPTFKIGKTVVVGFDEATYKQIFK
jgi:arsenate reductase-like glutaredoxin family protein